MAIASDLYSTKHVDICIYGCIVAIIVCKENILILYKIYFGFQKEEKYFLSQYVTKSGFYEYTKYWDSN